MKVFAATLVLLLIAPFNVALAGSCAKPPPAEAFSIVGKTILAFKITEQGNVKDVVVTQSSGNAILDAYATECAANWHYAPATKDGKAVEIDWKAAVQWGENQETKTLHLLIQSLLNCVKKTPVSSDELASVKGPTDVTVHFSADGRISDTAITSTSGDETLDREAEECFKNLSYDSDAAKSLSEVHEWAYPIHWK